MSSETPNDSAPIKSLRDVRSQSQTSTDSRLAWSSAVNELYTSQSLRYKSPYKTRKHSSVCIRRMAPGLVVTLALSIGAVLLRPSDVCWYSPYDLLVYFLANVDSRSRSLYVVARLSVCLLSVTFVRPTQPVEIFGNVSAPFGTLAIHWHPGKILRSSSHENRSVGALNARSVAR